MEAIARRANWPGETHFNCEITTSNHNQSGTFDSTTAHIETVDMSIIVRDDLAR